MRKYLVRRKYLLVRCVRLLSSCGVRTLLWRSEAAESEREAEHAVLRTESAPAETDAAELRVRESVYAAAEREQN